MSPTTKPVLTEVLLKQIYPKLDTCKLLHLILRRLAYILMLSPKGEILHTDNNLRHDLTLEKKIVEPQYSSLLEYSFSILFKEDIHVIIQDLIITVNDEEQEKIAKSTKKDIEVADSCIKEDLIIDTRGQAMFNQTQFYLMKISEVKLNTQEVKIKKSIYIEIHLEKEQEDFSKEDLIHKFIIQSKFKNKLEQYNYFLKELFQFCRRELLKEIKGIPTVEYNLFYYHLGPMYFLKYVVHHLQSIRSGFVHRYINRKDVLRELPFEYIKWMLGRWWDVNFFKHLPASQKDSRKFYNQIIERILQRWKHLYKEVILEEIKSSPNLKEKFDNENTDALINYLKHRLDYGTYLACLRFLGMDFVYAFKYRKITT